MSTFVFVTFIVALVILGIAALACVLLLAGWALEWWDDRREIRMSDAVRSFAEAALFAEDDRMEVLRRQLDERWVDDEDSEAEAEACFWSEVAELELLLALPAREPRNARS